MPSKTFKQLETPPHDEVAWQVVEVKGHTNLPVVHAQTWYFARRAAAIALGVAESAILKIVRV